MSDDQPPSWDVARLQDVLQPGGLFDGPFGSNLKTSDYTDSGVRVVRLENLANLRFIEDKRTYISPAKYKSLTKHSVSEGDVLFGSFLDDAVRVCLMPHLPVPAIAKADCFCIRPRPDVIDPHFLMYQLGRSATRDALIGEIHGATRPRVTTKQLRQLEILVPPLSQQKHIVERIHALLGRVNVAREHLTRASEILKRFRQSVLVTACSGRLTEEWRAHHVHEPLSADAVLVARRRAWVRAETTRRVRDGRPISAAGLLKRYVPPAEPDTPGDAPDSWLWTTLDQITLLSGGLTKGQKRGANVKVLPVPYLRVANVQRGHIDLSVIKDIEATDAEIAELQLQNGDILLNEGGDIDKLGRGWVWEGQIPTCIHQNHVFRARPVAESINPYFVSHYANAVGQDFFFSAGAQTVNLASLSLSKIRTLPVPLPPPAEQAEIVRRVGTLFALADTIECRLTTAAVLSRSLSHAILAKAFQGGLAVPS
jgi:type I restriction enzyme S subunit